MTLEPASVVVADDDPDLLSIHARLVREAGLAPLPARSGRQALLWVEHWLPRPIGVLTDRHMADGDGIWLARELQGKMADPPPIVLVTGTDAGLSIEERALFFEILNKPISPQQAHRILNAWKKTDARS